MAFLPTTVKEARQRGWDSVDVVLFTGDAYIDHPAFGAAVIGRLLEAEGYRVAVVPQPNWRDDLRDFRKFGTPRLFFAVTAGAMDSMVNHYTANKRLRSNDAYTPGGAAGFRPDYAVETYTRILKRLYPRTPVVVGGIEASLRRLTHYDYWQDALKPSILVDSGADLLIYGMGERVVQQVAAAMRNGYNAKLLRKLRQVAFLADRTYVDRLEDRLLLHSYEECTADPHAFAENFRRIETESNLMEPHSVLVEPTGDRYVVVNPANATLSTEELDRSFDLPYERAPHPRYRGKGDIPAWEMIKHSVNIHRGCFGGCSFCALTFHQGRIVQTRSHDSLLAEAARMTQHPDFKGYIHDVGGPTANFRQPACEKQLTHGACQNRQCLFPTPCRNLRADHTDYVNLLRELRAIPGVKKVFIRSGIRFDYLLADEDPTFLRELVEYHVSGQLKVAPEHVSDQVLRYMGKPRHAVYEKFCRKYAALNEKLGKKQYLVPYLMSSHPGCGLREAVELAEYVRDLGYMPEQVQDFYPTPSTLSTVMYYTGLDPRTMEPVYVPTDPHEKEMQRALIQYRDPKNYALIHEALVKAGRTDLIGYGPKCLIRPRRGEAEKAPHPAQKQPAQKRPAQKRERPAEKKPAAKPRKAQPAAREPRRAERGEVFGKPTAAQLRQAERYLKTRKKKQAVKKPTKPKASGGRNV